MGLFARKIFNLRREKIRGCFCRVFWCKKSTSRRARNMHHKDTYLRLKQTAIPHLCPAGREYQSSCVCPPGRNPGGNTRRSGVHRASRVVFLSLCSRILSQSTIFFLRRKDQCRKFNCRAARRKKAQKRERLLMHRQTDRRL